MDPTTLNATDSNLPQLSLRPLLSPVLLLQAEGEQVLVSGQGGSYRMRGYAYCGGGRRVTRVEVSFDEGQVRTQKEGL